MDAPLEYMRAMRANFAHLNDESWNTLENALTAFGLPLVEATLNMEGDAQRTTIEQLFRAMNDVQNARNLNQVAADAAARAAQEAANVAMHENADLAMNAANAAAQAAVQGNAALAANAANAAAHAVHAARPQVVQQQPAMPQPRPIKFRVSSYMGRERENILRWFIELETAMSARLILAEESKVGFAISQLAGRAKDWALGLKLVESGCFPSYEVFKTKLRATFEPTQRELRSRTDFLSLRQGNRHLHDYVQELRYLIACCVEVPIDPMTQITRFMMGLNPGAVRDEVYRHEYDTLDEAIRIALETEFRVKRNQNDQNRGSKQRSYSSGMNFRSRPRYESSSAAGGPTPMDISTINTSSRPARDKSRDTCHNCGQFGHWSPDCTKPRQSRVQSRPNRNSSRFPQRSNGSYRHQRGGAQTSKNVMAQ